MITRIDDSIFIHEDTHILAKWQPLRPDFGLLAFYVDGWMIHFPMYLYLSQDVVETVNPYAVSMNMVVDSYNAVVNGVEDDSYFNVIEVGTHASEHCASLALYDDKLTFSFWTSKLGDYGDISLSSVEWVKFLKTIREKIHIYDKHHYHDLFYW